MAASTPTSTPGLMEPAEYRRCRTALSTRSARMALHSHHGTTCTTSTRRLPKTPPHQIELESYSPAASPIL